MADHDTRNVACAGSSPVVRARHSAETRARISAGVKKARAEGKAIGRPFVNGHDPRRVKPDEHPSGCTCFIHARKPLTETKRLAGAQNLAANRSEAGLLGAEMRLKLEGAAEEALERDGYEVLKPLVVCDRVAIKDGKVYFVEFKRRGQSLRDGQRRVQELVPEMYLVRFYGE